jgi:hypothetical protein
VETVAKDSGDCFLRKLLSFPGTIVSVKIFSICAEVIVRVINDDAERETNEARRGEEGIQHRGNMQTKIMW